MSDDHEAWLRAHTFLCKLGRVSPAQCQRNRSKPEPPDRAEQLFEIIKTPAKSRRSMGRRGKGRHREGGPPQAQPTQKEPDSSDKPFAGWMPSPCATCKDFERLCKELCNENAIRKEGPHMDVVGSEVLPGDQPEICICHCGKKFEPYKRGATVVKTICVECLNKKNARPKRPLKDEPPVSGIGDAPGVAGIGEKRQPEVALDQASSSSVAEIRIVFAGNDEEMFHRIEKLSARQRRTAPAQILYWLESFVPELNADIAEK
ncbi:MAG: hypothetical protein WAN11_17480 [Syntrophobacteraceae bacterium]